MWLAIRPRRGGLPEDLGAPVLPSSKSHTQRAMVLAAFLPGPWRLERALRSADTEVLAAALAACGARLEWRGDDLVVCGRDGTRPVDAALQLGDNGTALRLLATVVPLLGGRLRLDGSERLRQRPIDAALQPLRRLGAVVDGDSLPCAIDGGGVRALPGGIDGSITTQVGSGVLLAMALRSAAAGGDIARLRVERPAASAYLQLTAQVLSAFGCRVDSHRRGDDVEFTVAGELQPSGSMALPIDASARAFPLALAAMHGRDGGALLPARGDDPHPDWDLDADLAALQQPGDVTLPGLRRRPDCVPAVAAVAAVRAGAARLVALPALRHKESDRLAAMAAGLTAAGAHAAVEADDLLVRGPLRPAAGLRELPAPADHRVVMALALLGTVAAQGVAVPHAEAVQKSWPGFFDWLRRCASVEPFLPSDA